MPIENSIAMTTNALSMEAVARRAINSHVQSTPGIIAGLVSSKKDTAPTTLTVLHGWTNDGWPIKPVTGLKPVFNNWF